MPKIDFHDIILTSNHRNDFIQSALDRLVSQASEASSPNTFGQFLTSLRSLVSIMSWKSILDIKSTFGEHFMNMMRGVG